MNTKDKNNLYKKELEEKRLLDAAMEQSPDDAQALLLIGSFTKKVLEKRKPRPHEIINNKLKPAAPTAMQSTASLKSNHLLADSAGYIEAYSGTPVKTYAI